MNVEQLREALAEFPPYYEVSVRITSFKPGADVDFWDGSGTAPAEEVTVEGQFEPWVVIS